LPKIDGRAQDVYFPRTHHLNVDICSLIILLYGKI